MFFSWFIGAYPFRAMGVSLAYHKSCPFGQGKLDLATRLSAWWGVVRSVTILIGLSTTIPIGGWNLFCYIFSFVVWCVYCQVLSFKKFWLLASVRVTGRTSVGPVSSVTRGLNVDTSRLRFCNGCGTGLPLSLLGGCRGGRSNGLVLMATVGPAPTNRKGAAIAMNLNRTVGHVNGGTMVTLHRPSVNPIFKVGNNTTNNNCTRMVPVRSVGLRFANSVRTVATTGGLLYTVVSGRVRRKGRLHVSPEEVLFGHYLSVGSETLEGIIVNLKNGMGNMPHRSNFVVAITDRVVTVLYLSSKVGSLGSHLNSVLATCACSNAPMCTESLGTINSVTTLLGSTVGPGLMRALRGAPTLVRNKPFTGVTRNYGSMATAHLTLGLNSCYVARTNFKTSLNTRGFLSVGYHYTNLGPSYIMVMTAVHTLGCGNNMPGARLSGRGAITLGGNVMGLRARVRGVEGCNLPIIITVGHFTASARTRVRAVRTFYGRGSIPISLARMFTHNKRNKGRLTRGIIGAVRAGRTRFGPVCSRGLSVGRGLGILTGRVCHTKSIMFASGTRGTVSRVRGLNGSGLPVYITGARCSLSSSPRGLNDPGNFALAMHSIHLSTNTKFVITLANSVVAVPKLPGRPTTCGVSISSSKGISKLF